MQDKPNRHQKDSVNQSATSVNGSVSQVGGNYIGGNQVIVSITLLILIALGAGVGLLLSRSGIQITTSPSTPTTKTIK
jgi:hypothetical protein